MYAIAHATFWCLAKEKETINEHNILKHAIFFGWIVDNTYQKNDDYKRKNINDYKKS